MNTAELKKRVADAALQSYREGLFAGTSGNLSQYDPEQGIVAITPSSVPYDGMTVDDIMVIDLRGTVLEGGHTPSSEWKMHTAVYKNRPDIFGVVHTHSPYATSFAVAHKAIPPALIEMIPFVGGDIPMAEFALPGTEELGERALQVLKRRKACLLANHGVLAVGETVERAHIYALYAEDAAKICCLAQGLGGINAIPRETQNEMRRKKGLEEE